MESESKEELPNWFLNSQRQKVGGYVNLMMEKKIKRKEYPSWQSLKILGIGYYLGRNPLQQNHTQPVEIGTEVQSEEPGLQLREPRRACPLEVCGPLGHTLKTQETPLRAVKVLCFILISPACR